jgi:cbb3-type cytochrome oxidase subunit 3
VTRFSFWGLFAVFGAILLAYWWWMRRLERAEEDRETDAEPRT